MNEELLFVKEVAKVVLDPGFLEANRHD